MYFVCFSFLLITTDVVRCANDYTFNSEAQGWFKLHTAPKAWEDALLTCHSEAAVLASPTDNQIGNALKSLIAQSGLNSDFFLGTHVLFDKEHAVSVEGVWLSDMGVTMSSRAGSSGDCVIMSTDGRAFYSSCTNPLPFICRRSMVPTECGSSDNGYNFNRRTRSCYKVHTDKVSWDRAYSTCASEAAHLVVINNAEEASIIQDMFPAHPGDIDRWEQFHIGLVAWGKNRTWMTIDGQDLEDVFNIWDDEEGQPDNYGGNQTRATFRRLPGKLDDIDQEVCYAMFVCEKAPMGNEQQIF